MKPDEPELHYWYLIKTNVFQLQKLIKEPFSRTALAIIASTVILNTVSYFLVMFLSTVTAGVLELNESITPSDYIIFLWILFVYIQFNSAIIMIASCSCLIVTTLNKALRNCLSNNPHQLDSKILRSISIIYCRLCDVTKSYSKAFGSMIIPYMLTYISYSLLFIYSVYVYQKNPSKRLLYFSIMTFSWVGYNFPPMLCYYACSSILASESHSTQCLLQQITAKKLDLDLLNKCSNFELLIRHQQPKLSFGLFLLSWETFFGMIASIFSYAVILVQFYEVLKE